MPKFRIPYTYVMYGEQIVEASSLDDAIAEVRMDDAYGIRSGEDEDRYVHDSFTIDLEAAYNLNPEF